MNNNNNEVETIQQKTENNSNNASNTNTSISLNNNTTTRQGIIEVVFNMNSSMLDWVASTWYDGKIIKNDNEENEMVPNSDYYLCNICNKLKSINSYNFKECVGTTEHKHKLVITIPQDWHPLLSRTGVNALIGELKMNINPNVQTANITKNTNDVASKSDLDDRLVTLATNSAIATVGSLLSNPLNYANWLIKDLTLKNLPVVFSIPFLEQTMTALAYNYLSSFTKGKNMAAMTEILKNRTHIEQDIINKTERSVEEQTTSNSNNGLWTGLFGFSKK